MKVSKLIEELQKIDGDLEIYHNDMETGAEEIALIETDSGIAVIE